MATLSKQKWKFWRECINLWLPTTTLQPALWLLLIFTLSWLPLVTAPSTQGFSMIQERSLNRMQPISLACPPEAEILPCSCKLRGPEILVKCENSVLNRVIGALEILMKRVMIIEELHLIGNRIHVLPARVFGSLQVNKLFLINNEILAINRNAFAGLETSLQHLYITDPELFNVPFDAFDNLDNMKTVVLENTDITEIPRLFSLTNLEFLKIDGSRISAIPTSAFRLMPGMKKVHIANSRLKEIHDNVLEGLVYLKEVNFSNNVIDWIHPRAFRTLTAVEQLTLSGNNIVDASMAVLAARDLRELRILDLSHNKIKHVRKGTFVDMAKVQVINLGYNLISEIEHGAFFRLPELGKIDVMGNKLNEFHADIFSESASMQHLNIAKNNLTFIADMIYISRVLPNLRSLDVSGNLLTAESFKHFGGHSKLEALKVDHNKLGRLYKGMFKDMPNLRELYVSHNSIKSNYDGQVWNLPKLRILDISHNDLETVDVMLLEGVSAVRILDLSFNMISTIGETAFLGLGDLEKLNVSFNSIKMIPTNAFVDLDILFELELSFNELMSLENEIFKGLVSLQYLHVTHNQILTIDENVFGDTPDLKFLDLSSNFVQQIPKQALSQLNSLAVLKMSQNVINEIRDGHLSGLKIVEHLDLSKNHIQTISKAAFLHMPVIRDLDLSTNFIQSLHQDMFSNTKLLEKLNISHNYVSNLGVDTFANTKRLRILDITNNSLTEMSDEVRGLRDLQGLFMSHNYISSLKNSTFRNLPNLSILKFDNNGLQTFEPGTFFDMESLISLDLRNNNLVELNPDSISSLHALKELQISKNQIAVIKDFAFSDLTSLRSLELQDNVIAGIGDHAFQNVPSLSFLNLSRNALQEIPADALARLHVLDVLDLSWNYILQITDHSFSQLEWLTVLMLHNNDLCRLTDDAFSKQRSLRVLTLQNNQLRHLHLKALGTTMTSLSLLDMGGNPFRCDCELVWLREYLNEDPSDHRLPRTAILGESLKGIPVCAEPPEYEGIPITQVPVEAFMCDGRRIPAAEEDICMPSFLDPLLFTAGHPGGGGHLDPGTVNTLLHLTNLSEAIPGLATGPSYLDVGNPIHVHDLNDLAFPTKTEKNVTSTKPNLSSGLIGNVDSVKLPAESENTPEKVISSSSIHTVTGDTPTIYAGSSTSDLAGNIQTPATGSSSLFSGIKLPTLPNILESISNFNLPNVGLNVNWANLPIIGRQESGHFGDIPLVPDAPDLNINKPMKGPDENTPIWIDGPVSPHPLFPAPPLPAVKDSPPPAPGITNDQPSGNLKPAITFSGDNGERLTSGVPGAVVSVPKPANIWRMKPKPGQVEAVQSVEWPNGNKRRPHQEQTPFTTDNQGSNPVLLPATHTGPGPNSGTPFLPGLPSHQRTTPEPTQPLIINHEPISDPQTPSFSLNLSRNASAVHDTTWGPDWSSPQDVSHNSDVFPYDPKDLFQSFNSDDPNNPISVVAPPDVSVLHHGTPKPVHSHDSTASGAIPKQHPDMAPSESQVIGGGSFLDATEKDVESEIPVLSPTIQPEISRTTPSTSFSSPIIGDYVTSTNIGPTITNQQNVNPHEETPREVHKTTIMTQSPVEAHGNSASRPIGEDKYDRPQTIHDQFPFTENPFTRDGSIHSVITTHNPNLFESDSTNSGMSKPQSNPTPHSVTERFPWPSVTSTASNFVLPATELTPLKTITQQVESESILPPDIFPPHLGEGVTIIGVVSQNDESKSQSSESDKNQPKFNVQYVNPQESYRPSSYDNNDDESSLTSVDYLFPDNGYWDTGSPSDYITPSRFSPGFVMPVDKSGDPLPGTRTRPNNTYISPSKSIGRGGIPTIERVDISNVNQEKVPHSDGKRPPVQRTDFTKDTSNSNSVDFTQEDSIPNTEFDLNDVNAIDWYYSNYFREYNPYSSLPVGGNKPNNHGTDSKHIPGSYFWSFTIAVFVIRFIR